MSRALPVLVALAAQVQLVPGPSAVPADPLRLEGGDPDDHAFARAAFGLRQGETPDEAVLRLGLAAVRATDRFRRVDGELVEGGVRLRLDPWPRLKGWRWEGDPPAALRNLSFPELRAGLRGGSLGLERARMRAEVRLRELGYPAGMVRVRREDGDARVVLAVVPGRPALVQRVQVEGHPGPYTVARLQAVAGLHPGRSLWTQELRRTALLRLRSRFVKDRRLEGTAECHWSEDGSLRLVVEAGPLVRLASEGRGLGWKRLKDLVPLYRAERYSPALLAEGERRILRYLRGNGYLDAVVTHRREVLRGDASGPEEVRITYVLAAGRRITLDALRFERNAELPASELARVASLPARWGFFGAPLATPELIESLEERVKGHYRTQGFPDVGLRRPPLEHKDGRTTLVLQVREGQRQTLRQLTLELPAEPAWDGWRVAEPLVRIFAEQPLEEPSERKGIRRFRSDRPSLAGVRASLEDLGVVRPGVRALRFTTERPLPLVKADLAQVLTLVRARVAEQGVLKPVVRLSLDRQESGVGVTLEVPPQKLSLVQRLVVQGAGLTRAKALLKEPPGAPGEPLAAERLGRYQARLGELGAFQRVDLASLSELPQEEGAAAWKDGDLLLQLQERSPWVFSSGFGYDASQGYYVLAGVQRLNLLGMGRTLDFGVRAGDGTIDNPTLRDWFPTGGQVRSVDMFSMAFTDPAFQPGLLRSWIPDGTQLRMEAAYIQENRSPYLIRRRRMTTALEWRPAPGTHWQLGHRFERVDVRASVSTISDDELNRTIRSPGRSVISAPYLQLTRDSRDNPLDPTQGRLTVARVEFANQLWGTSANSSYVKVDLRQQWNWALGYHAQAGVLSLAARLGVAKPTDSASEDLPLSERFFAGGPFTHRGVEPDELGPMGLVPLRASTPPYDYQRDPVTGEILTRQVPMGGQGLVLLNAEYRFPLLGQSVWGEVFCDAGQVYQSLKRQDGQPFLPPLRTSLGLGLIFKLGLPIKVEYAADVKRILGRPRSQSDRDTQLKSLLISAGFQF